MTSMELAALLALPAMEPPDGMTPDFDDPPNENTLAWVVMTFCMVVATTFFGLRLYAGTWKTKKVRPEEGIRALLFRCVERADETAVLITKGHLLQS